MDDASWRGLDAPLFDQATHLHGMGGQMAQKYGGTIPRFSSMGLATCSGYLLLGDKAANCLPVQVVFHVPEQRPSCTPTGASFKSARPKVRVLLGGPHGW